MDKTILRDALADALLKVAEVEAPDEEDRAAAIEAADEVLADIQWTLVCERADHHTGFCCVEYKGWTA